MIRFDGTVVHQKEKKTKNKKIKQNKTMTCKSLSDTTMESRADQRARSSFHPVTSSPITRAHRRQFGTIRP
jgi:hypothetical protein